MNIGRPTCMDKNYIKMAMHKLPPTDLNIILIYFFMNIKKLNGEDYEPNSLTAFMNGFQRILFINGSSLNLRRDDQFEMTRKVLQSRRKQLTDMGKGNTPNAARRLDNEEIDVVYQEGYFSMSNPQSLQRTLWWIIGNNFGHRARSEARKLRWGDIKVRKNSYGRFFFAMDVRTRHQNKDWRNYFLT